MAQEARVPVHLAIIPDGNRRWARQQGLAVSAGHRSGIANVERITETAWDAGVEVFSFWWGSPANLERRDPEEVQAIVGVLRHWLLDRAPGLLQRHGARFSIYGRWRELCPDLADGVAAAEAASGPGPRRLVLLMAYDGREELAAAASTGPRDLRELGARIWTADLPDVDLAIRTAGEPHLSAGFLLWHLAEAQLAFPTPPWPAFTPQDLVAELTRFAGTERRFGGDGRPDAVAASRLTAIHLKHRWLGSVGQGRIEGLHEGHQVRVDVPADGRPWSIEVRPPCALPPRARLWPTHPSTPEGPKLAAKLAPGIAELERARARVTVGAAVRVLPPNGDPDDGAWFVDAALAVAVALDQAVTASHDDAARVLRTLPPGIDAEPPAPRATSWGTRVTARLKRPLPHATLAARAGTLDSDKDVGDLVLDGPLDIVSRDLEALRDRLGRDAVRGRLLEALCDHPKSRLYEDRLVLQVDRGALDLGHQVALAASLADAIDTP